MIVFFQNGCSAVMNSWRISAEISVKLCFSVVGYGALESARTEHWTKTLAAYSVNLESTYDGMHRTLEDFQFDLGNALTISDVTRESKQKSATRSPDIRYPRGTEGKTAADVSVMIVTDQARLSGLKEAFVLLAANTAGRARATVREDTGTRRCIGLGQTARQVQQEHKSDVLQ